MPHTDLAQASDAELLACYVAGRDQRAFAEIVRRHGPMVTAVASRILRNGHDAEEAFQATFLALAAAAPKIAWRSTVAGWLQRTTVRTARSVGRQNGRWTRKIERARDVARQENSGDDFGEFKETLDKELSRLPDRYRAAVILCDLNGLSRQQAASRLGVPLKTVITHLGRGRNLLKSRLARRGITVSVASALARLADASMATSPELVTRTVSHALKYAAGRSATEIGVSQATVHTATGVLRAMTLSKFSQVAAVAVSVTLLGTSISGVSYMVSGVAKADTTLIADFADGTDVGWSRVDNTAGTPWGPGVFEPGSGSYLLETTGAVPVNSAGISDTLFSRWNASSDPQYSNGFWRAKVRPNTEATLFMLTLRVSGGNGYAYSGRAGSDTFAISRVDGTSTNVLKEIDSPDGPIEVGEDWIIEAGAVGDDLTMKFWRDGSPEPPVPQLSVTDSRYAQGTFLVGVRRDAAFPEAGQVSATFDDIRFAVPEPSGFILMAVGALALVLFATRGSR